jgi:hypothetical protein
LLGFLSLGVSSPAFRVRRFGHQNLRIRRTSELRGGTVLALPCMVGPARPG